MVEHRVQLESPREPARKADTLTSVLGPKLFFVTGLVISVTAVARLVCPDLLG